MPSIVSDPGGIAGLCNLLAHTNGASPMSTIDEPRTRTLPPLIAGQRLDQHTFHERYKAMPPETRAELVGGVVHMPSPLRFDHGDVNIDLSYWLGHYQRFTKGVRSSNNATVKLDGAGEVQPDTQLRIPAELGGRTTIDEGGYIRGAPELIVEIARSSRAFDLGRRRPITSVPGCWNMSLWSSTPTRSTGSSAATIALKTCLPGPTASIARRYSPASGLILVHCTPRIWIG